MLYKEWEMMDFAIEYAQTVNKHTAEYIAGQGSLKDIPSIKDELEKWKRRNGK